MSIRFESGKDLERETKAVTLFCDEYGLTFEKLSPNDIDFKIYKDGKFVSLVLQFQVYLLPFQHISSFLRLPHFSYS